MIHRAVPVQEDGDDVTSELRRPIPRAVPCKEDDVLILRREHLAGIEAQAEAGGMRTGQHDWRLKLLARMAPSEFRIGKIALIAMRSAEMLAHLGDAIKFVLRQILRQPVSGIVREVELLVDGIPVEADRIAHASGYDFRAGSIQIDAADLPVRRAVQHVVAGLPNRNIELFVRTDGNELPAVRLVLR